MIELAELLRSGHPFGVALSRLGGERWLAVSGTGSSIPSGTRVLVTGVRGTTLVVWPVGQIDPFFGEGSGSFELPPDAGTKEQS